MDLIGLLVFLYIAYRTATDKKRGKERTTPRRRVEQEMEQLSGMPYIQEERPPIENKKWKPKPEVSREGIEEIIGRFLGVEEFIPEERSISPEIRSEPMEQVKQVEEADCKPKAAVVKREHQIVNTKGSMFTGADLKQAVIWSEVLHKPKALSGRNMPCRLPFRASSGTD